MNAKLALMIASLFTLSGLTAITVGVPAVQAVVPEGYTCPAPGSPTFNEDPLFGAACAVAIALPSSDWLRTGGVINDLDDDGRPDGRQLKNPQTGANLQSFPLDLFFDDNNPATADTPFEVAGMPTGPFDMTIHNGNVRGLFRISNTFTNEVPFTDPKRGSNTNNAEEPYTIALYRPADSNRYYAGGYGGEATKFGEGVCILCVDVDNQRIVFGGGYYNEGGLVLTDDVNVRPGTPEGVIDIDADDSSIQSRSGIAVLHVRLPVPKNVEVLAGAKPEDSFLIIHPAGPGGPRFHDQGHIEYDEFFIHADGRDDIDDDGYSGLIELSCNSNPTNPRSTCDDVDGDGLANEIDDNPFVPLGDSDNDGIPDSVDNCINAANPTQADFNADGIGDACGDADGDGRLDVFELSGSANTWCTGKAASGASIKKTAGCPPGEPAASGATDPLDPDSDDDGINDHVELGASPQTDPNNADTDADTLTDLQESGPYLGRGKPNPTLVDTDADGLKDPIDNCVAAANADQGDIDADGIGDVCEASDMDNDGVSDADETGRYCTDPKNPDTDGDGLTDYQEIEDNKRNLTQLTGIPNPIPGGTTQPAKDQVDAKREFVIPCRPASASPVATPQVPAVFLFLSPVNADSNGDGVQDAPSDLLGGPSRAPAISTLNTFFPTSLAGPVGNVDEYDPHDVNADGKGNQYNEATGKYDVNDRQGNGQIDVIERNLLYYNPDESSHPAGYEYGRFEGNHGVTFTVFHNANGKSPQTTLRFGDVVDTSLQEVVVIESELVAAGVLNFYATACVAIVEGKPVLFSNVMSSSVRFATDGEPPCGEPSTKAEVEGTLNVLDPFALWFYEEPHPNGWVEVIDANRDGVPEELRLRLVTDPGCIVASLDGYCPREPDTVIPLAQLQDGVDLVFEDDPFGQLCAGPMAGSILCTYASQASPMAAQATGQPYSGQQGKPIAIAGTGTGGQGPYSCTWSPLSVPGSAVFTPSSSSCSTNVTYAAAGTHYLVLNVSDSAVPPSYALKTVPVTVALVKPLEAVPGGPYSGLVNTTIALTGSALNAGGPVTCSWEAAGNPTLGNASSCTGFNVSYAAPGTYQVKLTVDDGAAQASKNTTVTVSLPAAQTVDLGGPYSGATGQNVTLSPVITGGQAPFTCVFGSNGAGVFTDSSGDAPTCISVRVRFDDAGQYNLTVTVTDHHGRSIADGASISVQAPAPLTGNVTPNATNAFIGDNVTFTGQTAGGSGDLVCSWTSSPATDVTIWSPTSCSSTNAMFGKAGTYTLTFNATSGSETVLSEATVNVVRRTLEANAGPDRAIATGSTVNLSGTATNTTTGFTCVWTGSGAAYVSNTSACNTPATFTAAGTYQLILNVTDADGTFDMDSATVTVTDPEPPECEPGSEIFPECAFEDVPGPDELVPPCGPDAYDPLIGQIAICRKPGGQFDLGLVIDVAGISIWL